MQVPLQITFHGIDHSDALEMRVRREVKRLERYFQRITGCRVVIDAPHHRSTKGRLYHVLVDLAVPGEKLVVHQTSENHAHEDVFVAVRDAFSAARRQLVSHAEKRN